MSRPWRGVVLVGVAGTAAYPSLPVLVQTVLYDLFGLGCCLAVVVGLHRHRPARPAPWLLLAAGVLLWVLGDVAYSVLDVRPGDPPFPSVADVLYLAGYPAVALAAAVSVHRSAVRDTAAWQDAAICALGASVVAWHGLLQPILADDQETVLARAVAVAYPVMDLVVMLLVLRMVAGRGARSGAFGVLGVALGLYLLADTGYGVQVLADTYETGDAVDLGWLLSYTLIAALALHPRMVDLCAPAAPQPAVRSRRRLVALAAAALLAPGVLVVQELTGDDGGDVLPFAIASALMFLLVSWRSTGLIGELERMARQLRGREGELERRATTDVLTGLANRGVLTDRLERDAADGRASSLALLDLDDFKHVNDSRGHGVGDDLLVAVARRLTASVRSDELVARLGGDEFAVVSRRPPDELAAWLLGRLAEPTTVEGLPVRASASIGVTVVGTGERGADSLRHADIAMYAAKAAGGGRSVTYRPEMSAELLARLALREQLAEGVAAGEFVAWLQPVVDLRTHRLVGFEALARWQRPGRPPLLPGDWIPAAEETGLVVAVDDQVLRAAARTLVAWSATVPGAAALTLAVNASGRSLQEEDVAERVLLALADEGLDPHRLVLEVTEGVLVDDETAGARLQRLREAGVRIALDDFGTGWSSLSYLRRFPVDVLKLDRSFVAGVADGEGGRAVPAAVLQLAGALRLDVVAEGVETPEQAEALRALGCRTVQGYLFARPAPAHELLDLVRRGKVAGGTPVAAVPD